MSNFKQIAIFLAFSVLFSLAYAAEPCPIKTDGPDFVESDDSMCKGYFQYEMGPAYEHSDRKGNVHEVTAFPTLLRLGMGEAFGKKFELRMESGTVTRDVNRDASGTTVASGMSDTAFGIKWRSQDGDEEAGIPAVSWIAHAETHTPWGAKALKGHGIRPSIRAVIGWELPNDYSIGLMPGVKYDATDEGNRYVSGIFGATIGKTWGNFRIFTEIAYEQIAKSKYGGNSATLNFGASYVINKDLQIGGRVAFATTENAPQQTILFSIAQQFKAF